MYLWIIWLLVDSCKDQLYWGLFQLFERARCRNNISLSQPLRMPACMVLFHGLNLVILVAKDAFCLIHGVSLTLIKGSFHWLKPWLKTMWHLKGMTKHDLAYSVFLIQSYPFGCCHDLLGMFFSCWPQVAAIVSNIHYCIAFLWRLFKKEEPFHRQITHSIGQPVGVTLMSFI